MKEKLKKFGLACFSVLAGLGFFVAIIRALFSSGNKEVATEFPSKRKKELEKKLKDLDTEKNAVDDKAYSDDEITKRYNKP